jgi:predicted DNA-binding transcriptional regulator AlpA
MAIINEVHIMDSEETNQDELFTTYTVAELARACHCSRGLIYSLLKQGKGPRVMRMGKKLVIPRTEALAWQRRLLEESEATGDAGDK